jgi:hypothetical protein
LPYMAHTVLAKLCVRWASSSRLGNTGGLTYDCVIWHLQDVRDGTLPGAKCYPLDSTF